MAVSSIWFIQNVVRNGVFVVIDAEQVKLLSGNPFVSVSTVSPP